MDIYTGINLYPSNVYINTIFNYNSVRPYHIRELGYVESFLCGSLLQYTSTSVSNRTM